MSMDGNETGVIRTLKQSLVCLYSLTMHDHLFVKLDQLLDHLIFFNQLKLLGNTEGTCQSSYALEQCVVSVSIRRQLGKVRHINNSRDYLIIIPKKFCYLKLDDRLN